MTTGSELAAGLVRFRKSEQVNERGTYGEGEGEGETSQAAVRSLAFTLSQMESCWRVLREE